MTDSKELKGKVVQRETTPLSGEFNAVLDGLPGYDATKSRNLNQTLPSHLPDKRKIDLKLGAPTVRGMKCVVATDEPDEKEHFMIAIDLDKLSNTREDPVLSYCQPSDCVRDVRWNEETSLVVAVGKGTLQQFSIDPNSGAMKCVVDGKADPIHTDAVS